MSAATVFRLTMNGRPLAELELGEAECNGSEDKPPLLNELQPCSFEVADRETGLEYRVRIGDRDPVSADGGVGRAVGTARGREVFWDEAAHFDGARGRVWVHLASRPSGSDAAWVARARLLVGVVATKLSEARYETMLRQLRHLAAGLVLDVFSPMLRHLQFGVGGGVTARSSQVELRLLVQLWTTLARPLQEVVRSPVTRIVRVREVRPAWGGERFGPRSLSRLAAQGLDPRRPGEPRPFAALQERRAEGTDTLEHQVIAGLLRFLRQRVLACAADIHRHRRAIEADRPWRDRALGGSPSLYEQEDRPRLRKLAQTQARARRLAGQIATAQGLPLFRHLSPRLDLPTTPVFTHVRPYRQIRDAFARYLRTGLVQLQDGGEERLKSTQRMYEQWVYFQLAAALRRAGLRCANQEGLFQHARRFRFTLDVDRGAQLTFYADDGRAVVLRFEPWILPYTTAMQRGATCYRGTHGEQAWSPDILIEFLAADSPRGTPGEVFYAVVVDAKYSARIQEHHWADTRKYLQIRATHTRRQVVKQLWLAYPSDQVLVLPEDSALSWTERGPDCALDETIEGRLGLVPAADPHGRERDIGWIHTPEKSAQLFIEGLLNFIGLPRSGPAEDR
jgi:hypothetical protein